MAQQNGLGRKSHGLFNNMLYGHGAKFCIQKLYFMACID